MHDNTIAAPEDLDLPVGEELLLKPIAKRPNSEHLLTPEIAATVRVATRKNADRYQKNPHASLYAVDSAATRWVDFDEPQESARRRIRTNFEAKSSSQAYFTIRLVQKTYRVLAYAVILIGAMSLVFRLLELMLVSSQLLLSHAVGFFEYSFTVISTTLLIAASLLGAAELLQIVINIHMDFSIALESDSGDL